MTRVVAWRLFLLLVSGTLSCAKGAVTVGGSTAALTDDQCNHYQVGGKVTICHATGSTKNPFVVITVATKGCINGHADHPNDRIAVDGDCGPNACLAGLSPCDANVPCCDGFACVSGTCQATDLCAGKDCSGASDQCNVGECDPATGECRAVPKQTGTTCNDGDACTSDACSNGVCVGTSMCHANASCTATGCACNDGYEGNGQSCTPTTLCGNGVVEDGESCDDSNTAAGDGCGATCQVEVPYVCSGSPSVCTVPARPLVFGSFSSVRSVYPFPTSSDLDQMRAELAAQQFGVQYVARDVATAAALCAVDLFFINAWEVAPQPGEVATAMDYVERGGTLLLNAAGPNGKANVDAWLSALNLEARSDGFGCGVHLYDVDGSSTDPNVRSITRGRFGSLTQFSNRCESTVRPTPGSTYATSGVVPLAFAPSRPGEAVLALLPRTSTRKGQILIVTNFHIFMDTDAAAGGLMALPQSRVLLDNLAESAHGSDYCATLTPPTPNDGNGFFPPPPPVPTGVPGVLVGGFSGPVGIAIDRRGVLFITDYNVGTISTVDPRVAPAAVAVFASGLSGPAGLILDLDAELSGSIIVAERDLNRVSRIQVASGVAGAPQAIVGGISGAWGVLREATGHLLVSAEFGHKVYRVTQPAVTLTAVIASGLNGPTQMKLDKDGNLYVSDYFGSTVHKYGPDLNWLADLGGYSQPIGIAIDGEGGFYIANRGDGTISKTVAGVRSTFATGLVVPQEMAFDASGTLYVVNYGGGQGVISFVR